jgi:antitoxin (DNA-binding transcriptional repressor) of toxin-antitoxin stability system
VRRFPRDSPFVPSPLAGTLSGVKAGQAVAVAVNGRIVALSVASATVGPVRVRGLVTENAFRPGRDGVRVYVVTDDPTAAARGPWWELVS